MILRRGLLAALLVLIAVPALAQSWRPGFAPGFRAGFQFLSAAPIVPPVSGTTWSEIDKNAAWVLSNGNLTATKTGSTTATTGRSTTYKSAGKFYFEVNGANSGAARVGIASQGASTSTALATNTSGISITLSTGNVTYNNSAAATGFGTIPAGSVVGVAVDLDARTVAWYANGLSYVSTTIPVGDLAIAYGSNVPTVGLGVTLNTGATPFVNPIPAGYEPWN